MHNDAGCYDELRGAVQKLAGSSFFKHPLKKYRAYKELIQAYMKGDEGRSGGDGDNDFHGLRNELRDVSRLNIGCGHDYVSGWLNIGLFPAEEIPENALADTGEGLVLNFDMRQRLPIASGSVEYIYASHFIEHLDFQEGIGFLKQCHDLMKSGGIIRLTCPDMEMWIKKYSGDDTGFFDDYKSLFSPGIHPSVRTKGEIFMSQVHNWGHKWNYDFDSIYHVLKMVGFGKIVKKSLHESGIPEIRALEPDIAGRKLETMYTEAQKE